MGIPHSGGTAAGKPHGEAHSGGTLMHGAAGMQVIDGIGTGTGATSDGNPEQYTPGEPAYDGPAMAQLGIEPQPKGGRPAPITPEPHSGRPAPTGTASATTGGAHPQGSPLKLNHGPKKFSIEGAATNSNAVKQIAVTKAFLAISMNPPL